MLRILPFNQSKGTSELEKAERAGKKVWRTQPYISSFFSWIVVSHSVDFKDHLFTNARTTSHTALPAPEPWSMGKRFQGFESNLKRLSLICWRYHEGISFFPEGIHPKNGTGWPYATWTRFFPRRKISRNDLQEMIQCPFGNYHCHSEPFGKTCRRAGVEPPRDELR